VEGVSEVRQAVFSHFEDHYKVVVVERPSVENLIFVATLLKPFNFEEVKATVRDCASNKDPGPDGVTLVLSQSFGQS